MTRPEPLYSVRLRTTADSQDETHIYSFVHDGSFRFVGRLRGVEGAQPRQLTERLSDFRVGELGPAIRSLDPIEYWVDELSSSEPSQRERASRFLVLVGGLGIRHLLTVLESEDESIRSDATSIVKAIEAGEAASPLVDLLDEDEATAAMASRALITIGPRIAPFLTPALEDPKSMLRAATTLETLSDKPVIGVLVPEYGHQYVARNCDKGWSPPRIARGGGSVFLRWRVRALSAGTEKPRVLYKLASERNVLYDRMAFVP